MPIYEYRCEGCNSTFERIRKVSRMHNPTRCPFCNHVTEVTVPTTASFKIKGFRAANQYGRKFIDTYGKTPHTDDETGCSFHSNRGGIHDHNQGAFDKAKKENPI